MVWTREVLIDVRGYVSCFNQTVTVRYWIQFWATLTCFDSNTTMIFKTANCALIMPTYTKKLTIFLRESRTRNDSWVAFQQSIRVKNWYSWRDTAPKVKFLFYWFRYQFSLFWYKVSQMICIILNEVSTQTYIRRLGFLLPCRLGHPSAPKLRCFSACCMNFGYLFREVNQPASIQLKCTLKCPEHEVAETRISAPLQI